MTERRHLYRSRNALVGGVCAGIAERLDVDPVVARIFFVAFSVLTLGFGGFLYLALWAVLPKAPKRVRPVDVEPQLVHSDTFGVVDCRSARGRSAAAARLAQAQPYVSAAHLPPTPPSAARQGGALSPEVGEPGASMDVAGAEQLAGGNRESVTGAVLTRPSLLRICLALCAGCLLVTVGVSIAASAAIREIAWWQCWPLFFIVLGIVRMAVPAPGNASAAAFLLGVTLASAGLLLLPISVGIVAWDSLEAMTEGLWPLLVGAVALLAFGLHARSVTPVLVATLLVVMFCVLGLLLYAEPGTLRTVTLVTPLGREHQVFLPFTLFR